MSIATDLQTLYTDLQGVLTDCNTALTEKGGGEVDALSDVPAAITALSSGSSEGVTLPTLDNPASESDVLSGKEYIDQNGEKKTGTLEVSGDGGETETPVAGGAVDGTRHEFTIQMSGNVFLGSVACTLQPARYLVKVWTDTPLAEMPANRLVCGLTFFDSTIEGASSFKTIVYKTNTTHSANSPDLMSSSSSNLPTFDGTTFSWNVGAYFNKGTDYHLVVIDLSDDL